MTGFFSNDADCCGGMIAAGMPGCMPQSDHEAIAAEAKSFTGQYLRPLLEQASVKPKVVETKPMRPKRARKVEPKEPDLIGAK